MKVNLEWVSWKILAKYSMNFEVISKVAFCLMLWHWLDFRANYSIQTKVFSLKAQNKYI